MACGIFPDQGSNLYHLHCQADSLALSHQASLLLLLLLSRFSRVRLCATPQTPPSLGFSRQEHWSGLPFPSPRRESEMWKWSRSVVSDSSQPHGLQPTRLLHPRDFPGKSTGVGCHCLLRQNAVLGCNLKNDRMISVHFQGKPFNITVIQVYAPTTDAKEAGWTVLWRPIDFIELTSKKKKKEKMSFSS